MSNSTIDVTSPLVTFNGKALSAANLDALVDIRVVLETAAAGSATIRFSDPYFEMLEGTTAKIGAEVEIKFPDESGTDVSVFKGKVASIGSEQGASDRHEFVVTAYDGSQVLAHGLTPFTYTEMTVSDIVGKIAKRNSLTASCTVTGKKMDYFLQLDSDHAVLDDLARISGAEWWVEDKKLYFQKRTLKSPVKLKWGESLQRFSVRFSGAARVDDVTVRGWDPATQKAVTGKATRSAVTASKVGLKLAVTDTRASQAKAIKASTTVTDVPVAAADAAKNIAEGIQYDLAAGELHIYGEAVDQPKITAGSTVDISGAGTQLAGTFVVSRAEHVYAASRPLVTRFTGGRHAGGGLADQLLSAQRGSARNRRQFAIGTVTNVKDPDKTGRVKVKLPTISDKDESAWARILAPGAGKTRGLQLMPDVGDEVLVAFIGGDAANPVVLGGLWSKKNTPPIAEPVKGDKVGERSLYLGSKAKLAFTEGADASKSKVELVHAEAGTNIQFDKDGVKVNAKSGTKIVLKVGEASIEMKGDGAITLKGGDITIKASKNLSLQGQKVTIKGSTGATMDGGGSKVDLSPSGAKVQASGMTEIKGAMVKLN